MQGTSHKGGVAIVGVACRFPGATNPAEFGQLVRTSTCAISKIPAHRLDRDLYYSAQKGALGKTYCTQAGVVDDGLARKLPAAIDSNILAQYDLAHAHALAVVLDACHAAGLDPLSTTMPKARLFVAHLRGTDAAGAQVYATGVEQMAHVLEDTPEFQELPSAVQNAVTERIVTRVRDNASASESLSNIRPNSLLRLIAGLAPSVESVVNLDSACASSFQALDLAVRSIQSGSTELAIVASASYTNWHSLVLFSRAQALSATGSFPFDQRADGFISGDGYAAIVLKPLEIALRDKSQILGVIRATAISSDGGGKSLWAPSTDGQVRAIQQAWDTFDGAAPQYVEAHGTSTQLGDSTEVEALARALGGRLKTPIPVTSVKANIGHTRESAGLAGLIKTLGLMQDRSIPAPANFERPNNLIPWSEIPFYVPTNAVPWPEVDGRPRRAGVNSFGIGGLNVHVVVDERPAAEEARVRSRSYMPPGANIAIASAGCVFAGANSFTEFRHVVHSGASQITDVPANRWDSERFYASDPPSRGRSTCKQGGFVHGFTYDWSRHKIPPRQLETADPLQFYLLKAVDEAVDTAGGIDPHKTAVVVGTMFSGEFSNQLSLGLHLPAFDRELQSALEEFTPETTTGGRMRASFALAFLQRYPALLDETGSFTSSTLASRIARVYDLRCGSFAIDAAENSSLAAIEAAISLLETGAAESVICASGQRMMDLPLYESLSKRGVFAKANHWVPGEGAGVLILRRATESSKRPIALIASPQQSRTTPCDPPIAPVARQIGNTMGAAGMAAVLAGIAARRQSIVATSTGVGNALRLQIDPVADRPPRLAFLFAGQGAQFAGMLRDVVDASPEAVEELAHADGVLKSCGLPAFRDMAWSPAGVLGEDILETQIVSLVSGWVLSRSLRRLGIEPDVVAGHSYGDYSALVFAGSLTLADAVRLTQRRSSLLQDERCEGKLVAVQASSEEVSECLQRLGDGVCLSIVNGPLRAIIGCTPERLHDVMEAFAHSTTIVLKVPRPYHTPFLEHVVPQFQQALRDVPIAPPRIPWLSSLSGRYISDPQEIRAELTRHLANPLDYLRTIRRLADEQPTLFLEIGPRPMLTPLHCEILGRADTASCTAPSLTSVRAWLEGCGRPIATASPAATSRSPVAAPRLLRFDATAARRARNATSAINAPAHEAPKLDEFSELAIRFVCEQTGYPRDVVDLDADLEADLGVDSVKRAQLLAEFRDRYKLEYNAGERLTLADFPTLRTICDFARTRATQAAVADRQTIPKQAQAVPAAVPAIDPSRLLMLRGDGSHYDIGRLHASTLEPQLRLLLNRSAELLRMPDEVDLSELSARAKSLFGERGVEQLRGMSDVIGVEPALLMAYNVALCPEYLPGCSHFAARTTKGSVAHGTNEDAPLRLKIGAGFQSHLAVARPKHGFSRAIFAVPGQIGGINGINEHGLAITSALLLDQPVPDVAARGLVHGMLVQELLERSATIDAALEIFHSLQRHGSYSMIFSEASGGRIAYLEYSGSQVAIKREVTRICASNHSLLLTPAFEPPAHSRHRHSRLNDLLEAANQADPTDWMPLLCDQFDLERGRETAHATMNTVRRVDNLVSAIFDGDARALVTATPAGDGTQQRGSVELGSLFAKRKVEAQPAGRYVLRPARMPLVTGDQEPLPTNALLLGRPSIAEALRHSARFQVQVAEGLTDWHDSELAAFETLIVCPDHDERFSWEHVLSIYELVRRWTLSGGVSSSQRTLVGISSMGGDFGFAGEIGSLTSCALPGLLKAVHRDYPKMRVKLIDTLPAASETSICEDVIRELRSANDTLEAGWIRGERRVVRAIYAPEPLQTHRPKAGSIWVVSGGARGITFEVARELGRRYGVALHLLGTTSLGLDTSAKSREIEANLKRLQEEGIQAEYHVCDVSLRESVDATFARIRTQGPISGIVHGAGVEQSAGFERKDSAMVQATIQIKAAGALNLLESAAGASELEYFVGFGSISGRVGGRGQTDYSLASDLLAKIVNHIRQSRPGIRATTFHWPAWAQTGMAMRPRTRAVLELARRRFLPVAEGVEHFCRELEAGLAEPEIWIFDGHTDMDRDRTLVPVQDTPCEFLDRVCLREPGQALEAEVLLDANRTYLRDHCFRGKPLLPAAASIMMMLDALRQFKDESVSWTLREFVIRDAYRLPPKGSGTIRAHVRKSDGTVHVELSSEYRRSREGSLLNPYRPISSATACPGEEQSIEYVPPPSDLLWTAPFEDNTETSEFHHGPSMRALKKLGGRNECLWGQIDGSAGAISILDACFVACGLRCRREGSAVVVHGCESLHFAGPLAASKLHVFARHKGQSGELHTFDITLVNEAGRTLLTAVNCTMLAVGGQIQ